MPDQKPPRLAADELRTVLALLQFQRESFVRKIDGLDEGAASWSPVGSGTSLLWLTVHLARAERTWILDRFGAQDVVFDDEPATLREALEAYRKTWGEVDPVVTTATLDDPCRRAGDEPPVNLRWVMMHLLEETARHAGHADILRELIDGETGR